jgi:hypothetical protein
VLGWCYDEVADAQSINVAFQLIPLSRRCMHSVASGKSRYASNAQEVPHRVVRTALEVGSVK